MRRGYSTSNFSPGTWQNLVGSPSSSSPKSFELNFHRQTQPDNISLHIQYGLQYFKSSQSWGSWTLNQLHSPHKHLFSWWKSFSWKALLTWILEIQILVAHTSSNFVSSLDLFLSPLKFKIQHLKSFHVTFHEVFFPLVESTHELLVFDLLFLFTFLHIQVCGSL